MRSKNKLIISYTIFYDEQFIKVDENHVIPVIEQGDNNVWEVANNRRARDWVNSRSETNGKIIISNDELLKNVDLYKSNLIEKSSDYTDKSFGWHTGLAIRGKSTHTTTFNDYKRVFTRGISNAKTVEELCKYRVSICLYISPYCKTTIEEKGLQFLGDVYINTTEELVTKINEYLEYYKGVATPWIYLHNMEDLKYVRKVEKIDAKVAKKKLKKQISVEEYYVFEYGYGQYFIGRKGKFGGCKLTYYTDNAKSFMTEVEANKFLDNLKKLFPNWYADGFKVVKVCKPKVFYK